MSEPELKHDGEVEQLIAEHGGDVHAAIADLLSDRNCLIKELEYAALAMGHGFARGWKPKSLQSDH
ncbi:hypothetical protein [Phyllobacterium bourgognense]|uniref:Uncharacterized protein n=1 Tax=Phyllobacterium bourgognense TaxID=314236 RepID=A0A368YBY0_9HYPH|nr:hypothetical protein [Phyllobacterium bourgognense]RCW77702.1 hypothetical protein C7476_1399 [Phyllobacterium bourgognense]